MRYLALILLFISVNCNCQFINVIGGGNPIIDSDTAKWYFKNGGNDGNDGHTPATAKQTFPHLLTLDLEAGDSVFFNKGDEFRVADGYTSNQGNIPWIGAEGNHITFTSYGSGDKPRILGSDTITDWINHTGNIWKGYDASLDTFPSGRVFFHELDDSIKWGNLEVNVGDIDELYDYKYSNDTVYVYSESDPSTAFISVEIPQGEDLCSIFELRSDADSAEYYTWDGLELAFAVKGAIGCNWPGSPNTMSGRGLRGFEVRNCYIHHYGENIDNPEGGGIAVAGYSDVIIENNTIYDCARRAFSYRLYNDYGQDSSENILIQGNHFYDSYHTTGCDISGGAAGVVVNNVTIRRNIIENIIPTDVTSMGIFLTNTSGGSLRNVSVYNNLFRGLYGSAIQMESPDSTYIFNNTILLNNTTDATGFYITGNSDSCAIKNNIIYSTNTLARVMSVTTASITGYYIDYNLFFTDYPSSSDGFIYVNPTTYTQDQWATYKSTTGWDANSPTPADPIFKDPPDSLVVYSNSPAADAGIAIPGYDTDYEEKPVGDPPNIGAYERTQTYLGIDYDPTNRYVDATDGKDANTGTHPDSAWQTISKVNSYTWSAGDTCYFDGNEIYRGQISNPEDGASGQHVVFTISPYGSSVKPIITTAIDESSTSDWAEESPNLWLNEDANFTGANYNVGNIILRTTATSDAISVGYNRELEADVNDTIGEFFYDTGDDDLLVYCTSNPATYWGAMAIPDNNYINIAINSSIVDGGSSDYITYDGLAFNWTGRHGISYNAATNDITVKNCDFNIIGGSENYDDADFQLGNAIEFYTNNYTDIIITGCKFYQIFDASITPQYAAAGLELNNFYINSNLFIEVRYAFEFAWGVLGEAHIIHFNNNTCYRTSNYVFKKDNRWSTSLEQMGFVTFYAEQNAANTDVDIYNNIFYYEDLTNIASAGVRLNFWPWPAHITCDYNLYYSPDAFSGDHCLGNYSGSEKYTLSSWQSDPDQDDNGYNSDPDFKNPITNFRVGPGDAVDGGIAVAEYDYDYEGVEVVDPPHIGALETTED